MAAEIKMKGPIQRSKKWRVKRKYVHVIIQNASAAKHLKSQPTKSQSFTLRPDNWDAKW